MKRVIVASILLCIAGCGVDWFPTPQGTFSNSSTAFNNTSSAKGNAMRPAAFTFTTNTFSAANVSEGIDSDIVTMSSGNSDGWSVSVDDSPASANSTVTIVHNGVSQLYPRAGNTLGTVTIFPNDTLTVTHNLPVPPAAGTYVSTVHVGSYQTTFTTKITQ
jgi:hypothetical protein